MKYCHSIGTTLPLQLELSIVIKSLLPDCVVEMQPAGDIVVGFALSSVILHKSPHLGDTFHVFSYYIANLSLNLVNYFVSYKRLHKTGEKFQIFN